MQCVAYHCFESWSCKQRAIFEPEYCICFVCMLPEVLELLCDLHWTDVLFAWSDNDSGPSPELICFATFESQLYRVLVNDDVLYSYMLLRVEGVCS